jgi:hypothetical protein
MSSLVGGQNGGETLRYDPLVCQTLVLDLPVLHENVMG